MIDLALKEEDLGVLHSYNAPTRFWALREKIFKEREPKTAELFARFNLPVTTFESGIGEIAAHATFDKFHGFLIIDYSNVYQDKQIARSEYPQDEAE